MQFDIAALEALSAEDEEESLFHCRVTCFWGSCIRASCGHLTCELSI